MAKLIGVCVLAFAVGMGAWALHVALAAHAEEQCQIAKLTVFQESDLLAAAGRFPIAEVTDRWKALLVGCE